MDPYYAIFNPHYSHHSYKSLCHMHEKYLPFLSSLGIHIEEILIISFTSSGGVKAEFKSSAPLSKLSNTTYEIDGCPGIKVIKPFDPTWVFTGLSSALATPEDVAQVISLFGAPALPPEWEKTPLYPLMQPLRPPYPVYIRPHSQRSSFLGLPIHLLVSKAHWNIPR